MLRNPTRPAPHVGLPCANCGHSWLDHVLFDERLERYIPCGCGHWSGCECKQWRESEHA
jgi:hypothetical protein